MVADSPLLTRSENLVGLAIGLLSVAQAWGVASGSCVRGSRDSFYVLATIVLYVGDMRSATELSSGVCGGDLATYILWSVVALGRANSRVIWASSAVAVIVAFCVVASNKRYCVLTAI